MPNPHPGDTYLVRFTAPEFTTLCPVTGQPDFAHLVIDYVPDGFLVESKSLKLFLGSFRNHGAFHEDCTLTIAKRVDRRDQARLAAHRRLLVSARRHADRRVLSDRRAAGRAVAARSRRGALSRARLSHGSGRQDGDPPERRWISASMRWVSPGPISPPRPSAISPPFWPRLSRRYGLAGGAHARARMPASALWPEVAASSCWASITRPDGDALAGLGARRPRQCLGLCARPRLSRYLMKARLKAARARWIAETLAGELKIFVDTAPVMEKPLARRRRHRLAGQAHQSGLARLRLWLFLGEILPQPGAAPDAPEADHCGACRACLDACPTKAFPAPYRLDARRCISYLTIEHKGHIPADAASGRSATASMAAMIASPCVPGTNSRERARETRFAARAEPGTALGGTGCGSTMRVSARVFAGSPVKRIGRDRFVRNVLIAIGNSGDGAHRPIAQALRGDSSPLVAEAAAWALKMLE